MLSKIFSFSTRKADKKAPANEVETHPLSNDVGFYPDLEARQIRVLIFKDCDRKGKKLLYDTKVSSKSDEKSQNSSKNQENLKKLSCGKGECQSRTSSTGRRNSPIRRPSSDSTMLGEMIFGSVAMTVKGSTVKVHIIRSPHQLLLTKVFSLKPVLPVSTCYSEDSGSLAFSQVDSLLDSSGYDQDSSSLSSQNNSPKDFKIKEVSIPVAVPGAIPAGSIEPEDDSGFTASLDSLYLNSCSGSMTSLCNLASSPCGNLQRRLHRSQAKSIEKHRKTECGLEEPNSPILRRQPKIGIGVLLPLEGSEEKTNALQGFFFSHYPLFDSHMHRLRCAIEKAFWSRNSFSAQIIEALDTFSEDVCNLFKTPRLKEPVWLHMMTFPDDRRVLCEQFMEQFTDILKLYNNRETGFFLSSLLSAVLTHHLAWVPTVMPAGAAPNRAYLDKHSSQTLDLLAQSHPYNPLWAQLSDLYGAIGFPLKLARTVVTGKNSKLVGQLLNLISYFIRCTEVFDHNLQRAESKNGNIVGKSETEYCCLCSDGKDVFNEFNLYHKHNICESCMERSGLSICINCQKLIPKELTNITKSDKSNNLPRRLLEGLPCCDKCGLLQKQSNVNGLIRLNTLSGSCSCLPKWVVAKDLQHFLDDLAFSERSETFKCYCCEVAEPIQDTNSDGKPTFQCYCIGDNTCSHCSNRMNGFNHNARTDFMNSGHCLENAFMELLARDQICTKLVCSCDYEVDIDIHFCENKKQKNSHGRSGSLDSGFDQNSSSSCDKIKGEVECLSIGTLEDYDDDDCGPEELPLLGIVNAQCYEDDSLRIDKWRKSKNFGRTLFSGVSDTYHPDFVLQGVTCNKENILPNLSNDLLLALQHSVIDDVLSDAVCIIADTDNWTCELISAKRGKVKRESIQTQPVEVSNLVLSMLSSVTGLRDIHMPAEFCLMHLEDRLKEIYLKSRVIAEWLCNSKKGITKYELARTLGIDDSDMLLLLAVASSHSPQGMANLQ